MAARSRLRRPSPHARRAAAALCLGGGVSLSHAQNVNRLFESMLPDLDSFLVVENETCATGAGGLNHLFNKYFRPYDDLLGWRDGVMAVGFGVPTVLLVAYFVWEDGPCHRSLTVESWYLTVTLMAVWWTSMLMEAPNSGWQILQLIRLLLVVHILGRTRKRFEMHPRFHDGETSRQSTISWIPAPTPRARRMAQQLNDQLSEILQVKCGKRWWVWRSEQFLGPLIFILLIFREVMMQGTEIDCPWPNSNTPHWIFYSLWAVIVLQGVMLLNIGICFFVLPWQLRPLKKKLDRFVQNLIDNRDKDDLRYVLSKVSVGTLLAVSPWSTTVLLTNESLMRKLLCPMTKAILIDALQKKGIRASPKAQQAVERLLISCSGADMTTVKNLVDGSGSYLNLYYLIYHQIKDREVRKRILDHFEDEARVVRTALIGSRGIKILSDVDDTLYSSGGKFPAGCDKRYPKHVVYPGCLGLFRVLDREFVAGVPSCNVVFLSARPHVYKNVAEDRSYQLFKMLTSEKYMHNFPTLLPGKKRHGVRALLGFPCRKNSAWKPVGDRKLKTYKRFKALYLEYDFVFCGDNGQGDLLAGEKMIAEEHAAANVAPRVSWMAEPMSTNSHLRSRLLGALIHEVVPEDRALALDAPLMRSPNWKSDLGARHIFFHRTYVGAALLLHHRYPDLVSAENLAVIANLAVEEFDTARLMYHEWDHWAEAERELQKDLDAVDEVVLNAGLEALQSLRGAEALMASRTPCTFNRPEVMMPSFSYQMSYT